MKTRTESVLRTKALISWVYLLIAIGLIAITIVPAIYTEGLLIMETKHVVTGYHSGHDETLPGIPGCFLWVLAILYIVHFSYGAIYYPNKYRKVLREKYVPGITEAHSQDGSFGRGVLASLAVCLVMYLSVYDNFVRHQSSDLFWGIFLFWIALNSLLLFATQTSTLFERTIVTVDKSIFTPWVQSESESSSSDYEDIIFDYPVAESKEEWKVLVATAYAVLLKNEYNQEKLQESEAKKLSQKIMQNQ